MRVYRSPTLLQNLPHQFNGDETRAQINTWACFPNHETTFDIIEDFDNTDPNGMLKLIGTLGAEVGTFSYDAVGLFLEDDTLYAIGATSRLLTKRKAYVGSSANIHELRFTLGHKTVKEAVNFHINETVVNYTKITEVQYVHELPKASIPKEVIYRVTNSSNQTYQSSIGSFKTFLASQRRKYIGLEYDDVWVLHDHIQLFERLDLKFTIHAGKLQLSVPISKRYPVDLIPNNREVIISFFNPHKSVNVPAAMKLMLESKSSDSTNQIFTFAPVDYTLASDIMDYVQLHGTLYIHGSDCIYQDAIQSAIKTMTEIQYSAGRKLQTDNNALDPNLALQNLWSRSSTWKKLDGMIPVATSVFDGRLFNPSQLQPIVVKPGSLRNVDLRATNLWLNTENGSFQPTLKVDKPFLVYGQSVRATITAEGVQEGTQIAWYANTPDKDGLVRTPSRKIGYAILDATGTAHIDFTINWPLVDTQYPLYIGLVGYNIERIVTLIPLSVEFYYSTNANGTDNITQANEGDTVYLIAKSTMQVTGLELYLKVQPTTTTNDYDFIDGLPLNISLGSTGIGSASFTIKEDFTTEGPEILVYGLYVDADRTSKLGNDITLSVGDTSLDRQPVYSMFYANAPDSNVALVDPSKLGDTVWLIVTATDVPATHTVNLAFSGDLDRVVDAEPNIPDTLSLTLTNGRGSYKISTIAPEVEQPTGPVQRRLIIASNRTTTFNLYNEYVALFGTPSGDLEVTLEVKPGVYVVGTDTSVPAIDARGNWSSGTVLKVENSGYIVGRGGDGGSRSLTTTATNVPGGNGGAGILAQDSHPVYVTNKSGGYVSGGGGGSGGAYMSLYYNVPDEQGNPVYHADFWSLGGAGGAPLGVSHVPTIGENPGDMGGGDSLITQWNYYAPPNATLTTAGSGSQNMEGGITVSMTGGSFGGNGSVTGVTGAGKKSNDGIAGPISIGPVYISAA